MDGLHDVVPETQAAAASWDGEDRDSGTSAGSPSVTSASSSMTKGGVFASFKISTASTNTSISPVGRLGFFDSSGRAITWPVTDTTHSLRKAWAALMHRCVTLGVKHYLRDSGSVPQIDEHDHAVVAPPLDPAIQDDGLPDSGFRELPASMSSALHATFAFFGTGPPDARLTGLRLGRGVPASLCPPLRPACCSASSRSAFASRSVKYLNSPDCRSPSDSGPILIRVSFNDRMTDRFQHTLHLMLTPFTDRNLQPRILLGLFDLLDDSRTRHAVFQLTPCSNCRICSSVTTCFTLMR